MDNLPPHSEDSGASFLAHDGELGPCIAAFDWSRTTLGPIESWPSSLATAAGIVVHCAVPMVLLWGQDGVMIYNDAFATFAGERHPELLGAAVREAWPEVADFNDNVMRVCLAKGTLSYRDRELTLRRRSRPEQVWTDLDYGPVLDRSGRAVGVIAIVVETTERVRAERARADAEIRVSQILESMAEGFLLLDPDFRVLGVNAEALRHVEQTREQIMQLTLWDLWSGVGDEGLRVDVQRAMRERTPLNAEYRYVWRDGRMSWLEARAYPHGSGLAVFYRDVTRRKRAEERQAALLALGARLRERKQPEPIAQAAGAVLGAMLGVREAVLAIVQPDGAGVAVLEPWSADQDTDAITGARMSAEFAAHAMDRSRGAAIAIEEVAASETVAEWRGRFARAGIVAFAAIPLLEAGRVVGLLCVAHNRRRKWPEIDMAFLRSVADRTWAALQTAAAEADLVALNLALERQVEDRTAERDRIWRNSRDLLIAIGEDGIYRAINPAWTAILGHAPEEVVGRSVLDFLHPDDVGVRPDPAGFETRHLHKDGGVRWISWRTSTENKVVYAYGRDITLERQAAEALARTEAQLRQSQKMEAVGQLTGGLAHDFNNLLAGMSGSLELLQTRIEQGRIDDLGQIIALAAGAAQRATALTQRLLAFSRRQTLDPVPTEPGRLIADMEDLLRPAVGPRVSFAVIAPEGLWTILVDMNQLENALLNLCINANDAMPQGGSLAIKAANTSLDARTARDYDVAAGDYVCISVIDTGTGMTQEAIARGFDPFFTTKPPGEGTGLGLSMVYGFIRQSGGHVRILSALGDGTTVCLYLPCHKAA